jgi:hypothetical protein
VKIIAIISVVVVLLLIGVTLFLKTGKWEKTRGVIKKMQIREEYTSPQSDIAKHDSLFRYRVDVEYDYSHKGKSYTGKKIYPLLPNVFETEKQARETMASVSDGANVTVYFDPGSPSNSSLVTSEGIGLKNIVIIISSILLVAIFIVGGIYIFKLV